MKNKYLSIITSFGCHYSCPYCIAKNNDMEAAETTVEGLDNLVKVIYKNKCNWVSISGTGDPLYMYNLHVDWWDRLFEAIPEHIMTELHTSYIPTNRSLEFMLHFDRVVYHARKYEDLQFIKRDFDDQIVRVVFVVTKEFTEELINKISDFVKTSKNIDELSFRQMVDNKYKKTYYCEEYLKKGHMKNWYYIEQYDYNLYYSENKVYKSYKDFKKKKLISYLNNEDIPSYKDVKNRFKLN